MQPRTSDQSSSGPTTMALIGPGAVGRGLRRASKRTGACSPPMLWLPTVNRKIWQKMKPQLAMRLPPRQLSLPCGLK